MLSLGSLAAAVRARLDAWRDDGLVQRLWAKDPTLWSAQPVPELADRLGWLDLPQRAAAILGEIGVFAREVRRDGVRQVVLLGMGGSSLAPEVFSAVFGEAPAHPRLTVVDSTHPDAVAAAASALDLASTLFIVSSKSGTTIETASLGDYFWERCAPLSDHARHFVAITDPGSALEQVAAKRGFRRVFLAPSDVGGRYSALSVFGLVPAALVGVDVAGLVARAAPMGLPGVVARGAGENPGLVLGAVMGEAGRAGRDKLTLVASRSLAAFPAWIEQLVAESTGKDGRGIVPVTGEPLAEPGAYGDDRLFVSVALDGERDAADAAALDALERAGHPVVRVALAEALDLGAEFYRWEVATAAAGQVLGVHPFDQPDVQLAKDLAKRAMAAPEAEAVEAATPPEQVGALLDGWLAGAGARDYVALQAFLAPAPQTRACLRDLAAALRARTRLPVTAEVGPRFLHSTGQIHKGGADNGLFLQIADRPQRGLAVPGGTTTFDRLIAAQARGDAEALRQRGRRVLRVVVDNAAEGLEVLREAASRRP